LRESPADLTADEDLVAVWRSQQGSRFQNYRAQFTILDIATASRAWINDVLAGDALSANRPGPWRRWITGRHHDALISTRIEYRSRAEQIPADLTGRQILERIRAHFAAKPTRFEYLAAHLRQVADGHVGSYEVTRASVDGGRDAIGEYRIGPPSDPVAVHLRPGSQALRPLRQRSRRRRSSPPDLTTSPPPIRRPSNDQLRRQAGLPGNPRRPAPSRHPCRT